MLPRLPVYSTALRPLALSSSLPRPPASVLLVIDANLRVYIFLVSSCEPVLTDPKSYVVACNRRCAFSCGLPLYYYGMGAQMRKKPKKKLKAHFWLDAKNFDNEVVLSSNRYTICFRCSNRLSWGLFKVVVAISWEPFSDQIFLVGGPILYIFQRPTALVVGLFFFNSTFKSGTTTLPHICRSTGRQLLHLFCTNRTVSSKLWPLRHTGGRAGHNPSYASSSHISCQAWLDMRCRKFRLLNCHQPTKKWPMLNRLWVGTPQRG